jgi:hypothetical protein
MRRNLWALVAVATVASCVWASPLPAAAASPPAPAHKQSRPDLGIVSERRRLLASRKPGALHSQQSSPRTLTCGAAWRVVGGQDGSWNQFLGGVAAVSPSDIWAVGTYQDPYQVIPPTGYLDRGLAEHWDGTAWTRTPYADAGSNGTILSDVAASATNDVWAVGAKDDLGVISGAALHWNGTNWNDARADVQTTPSVWNAVAAFSANEVWLVGAYVDVYGNLRTMISRWNGTRWLIYGVGATGTGDNVLYGVGGSGPNDVWMVGYWIATPTSTTRQTLMAHWDGTTLSMLTVPTSTSDTLTSVAADSPTNAWAIGYSKNPNGSYNTINLHWDGTAWTSVATNQPSVTYNILDDVVAVSSSNYVAVGSFENLATGAIEPFVDNWNGSTWTPTAAMSNPGTRDNEFFSVAAPAAGDVWAVGAYRNPQNLDRPLIENYSGLTAPLSVSATGGDQSATVAWTAPCSTGGSAVTSYVVTAHDGCTIQGSTTVTGLTATMTGLNNGNSYSFTVAAVNGFGTGPQSGASPTVTLSGSAPSWLSVCSSSQYSLAGSDGSTWQAIDATNLSVSFTPPADSFAVLSGNADLWTANAGYNQDIGVAVNGDVYPSAPGQPEAWKESGGFAGTFSPNAAYVQTVIPVVATKTYTVKLVWKANKPDPGTLFAGAGPIAGAFSPTRLMVQLIPTASARVFTKSSTTQYHLTGSDGSTWSDLDPTNLSLTFTPPAGTWMAYVGGNADLWTSSAGYNQDIGVAITGGAYPTTAGQPEAWKESGGLAGTFSPNAAYVEVPLAPALTGGTTYTAKLQWKSNQPDTGSIWAGAGPINRHFSRTALTVILAAPTSALSGSPIEYEQVSSDGEYWRTVDQFAQFPYLVWTLAPSVDANYRISANADLWTSVAGYNQDLGIMVQGGAYGPGTVVAWKEGGGSAGTFSPDAAFIITALHLQSGNTYKVWLVWKANRLAAVENGIFAGAGPINNKASPTWLTAMQLA